MLGVVGRSDCRLKQRSAGGTLETHAHNDAALAEWRKRVDDRGRDLFSLERQREIPAARSGTPAHNANSDVNGVAAHNGARHVERCDGHVSLRSVAQQHDARARRQRASGIRIVELSVGEDDERMSRADGSFDSRTQGG